MTFWWMLQVNKVPDNLPSFPHSKLLMIRPHQIDFMFNFTDKSLFFYYSKTHRICETWTQFGVSLLALISDITQVLYNSCQVQTLLIFLKTLGTLPTQEVWCLATASVKRWTSWPYTRLSVLLPRFEVHLHQSQTPIMTGVLTFLGKIIEPVKCTFRILWQTQ